MPESYSDCFIYTTTVVALSLCFGLRFRLTDGRKPVGVAWGAEAASVASGLRAAAEGSSRTPQQADWLFPVVKRAQRAWPPEDGLNRKGLIGSRMRRDFEWLRVEWGHCQ